MIKSLTLHIQQKFFIALTRSDNNSDNGNGKWVIIVIMTMAMMREAWSVGDHGRIPKNFAADLKNGPRLLYQLHNRRSGPKIKLG